MELRNGLTLLLALAASDALATTRIVTDVGDTGDGLCNTTCTLREAIDASQEDDRILFDLALPAPIVIGLTGTPLQIDVALRITATDGVRTTLRRTGGSGRLIDVIAGGDARIIGLGFENGSVYAAENVVAEGGAIFVAANATLELRDCVFRGNQAFGATGDPMTAGPGSPARGGAIYAAGTLLVENCAFVDNHAVGGEGAFDMMVVPGGAGGAASGGAIAADGNVDVVNSTFSGNAANGGSGGAGGAGNAGFNGANGGPGGSANGGAIAFAATATPTLAFATLIANSVSGGTGGPGGMAGEPDKGPPTFPGADGANGSASGAAIDSGAATIVNVSVIAANTGAAQCAGAALAARTSNRVADATCPGVVVAALASQFAPIDTQADSPHYAPLFGSDAVDSAPDCLDAVALEAVDLDQVLTTRPLKGGGVTLACDFGAIELNPVMFADGFEEPPPAP